MRIRKIRLKQNGVVELKWENQNGQDVETTELTSRDAPLPEFTDAVQDLKGDFLHVLGLPVKKVEDNVEMTGVSISETSNGVRQFILTGKLSCPGGGTVGLASPRVSEPSEEEEADGDTRLTEAQVERIQEVEHQAARYASGERVQRQLELEAEEEQEQETAGAEA